jgi:cell division protein FtsI (penicillin-binding protein 3)
MESERGTRIRIRIFGVVFILLFLVVAARACYLQIVMAPDLQQRADQQRQRVVPLAQERGSIFDHNGDPLAVSIMTESLYADPFQILDSADTAAKLAKLLDASEAKLTRQLSSNKRFVWLQRKLEPQLAKKVEQLKIKGLYFVSEPKRYYPQATTASHVIGFTGLDPNGLEGIELEYDSQLQGEPGRLVSSQDAQGRGLASEAQQVIGGEAGNSLYLTLDRSLQFIAEQELAKAVAETKAVSGTLVVMEPSSGRILAMASVPTYNPNQPGASRTSWLRNRAVTDAYEPGSTFKPILLAAALEEGVVKPGDKVYCENGRYTVSGKTIRDHNKKYGDLTLSEALKVSSNIGFAKIGKKLERERFYSYIRDFGFGEQSGVDLPGEVSGLVRKPSSWFEIDLANISFGQGISVTALQITTAFSAIANGGLLMEPYLVEKVTDEQGQLLEQRLPQVRRRVISEKNAAIVREMMVAVTEKGGTAPQAAIAGFRVAGKTGTAQKVDSVTGGYSLDKMVSSFVGMVPADNPAMVVSVTINEPEGSAYGGVVAAPVFANFAGQALSYLDILPKGSVETIASVAADSAPLPDLSALLPEVESNDGLVMPDLRGMSYRQVLNMMQEQQLNLKLSGSGQVVEQSPAPGRTISFGKQAWVRFGV